MADPGGRLDFEGLTFRWERRRVRRARIEFTPPLPLLVIPPRAAPGAVLAANREAVHRRYARMRSRWAEAAGLPLLNRSEEEARRLATVYLQRYTAMLGVEYRVLAWRRMTRRWGTCHKNGTIRLNRFLAHLPEPLVAYVVFHETLHLLNMRHDKRFRRVVAQVFPNHRDLEALLDLYGMRMRHPEAFPPSP